jgi:hypothetical protein
MSEMSMRKQIRQLRICCCATYSFIIYFDELSCHGVLPSEFLESLSFLEYHLDCTRDHACSFRILRTDTRLGVSMQPEDGLYSLIHLPLSMTFRYLSVHRRRCIPDRVKFFDGFREGFLLVFSRQLTLYPSRTDCASMDISSKTSL